MSNAEVSKRVRGATYPFAIYSDLRIAREPVILQLGYLLHSFHVRCIAPSTENHRNLGFRINVRGSDQRPCGITRESDKIHRDILLSI